MLVIAGRPSRVRDGWGRGTRGIVHMKAMEGVLELNIF